MGKPPRIVTGSVPPSKNVKIRQRLDLILHILNSRKWSIAAGIVGTIASVLGILEWLL